MSEIILDVTSGQGPEECEGGTVCDPLRSACVRDCRAGDALSACAAGSCDAETGLCAE